MSFILDALKKAERQRPPGPVPDLFAVHGPQALTPRRPALAISAGVLLLAVAGLLVWAWSGADRREGDAGPNAAKTVSPPGKAATAKSLSSPRRAPAPAPAPASAPAGEAAVQGAAVVRTPVGRRSRTGMPPADMTRAMQEQATAIPSLSNRGGPAALSPPAPLVAPPAALPFTPPVAPSAAAPAAQPVASQVVAPTVPPVTAPPPVPAEAPPADGRVVELNDLPASIRAGLPKLVVSGHVWSDDPTLRLMTVDDRLLHEGGEAAPGVRLQEITPEGGVFDARGWHFRVSRVR